MPPFPPLFLTRNSLCHLIRRLTNPWTYRTSFFTGYDKARHLGGLRSRQGCARFRLDQADVRAVNQAVDRDVFPEIP
jgi:hypothetical protein